MSEGWITHAWLFSGKAIVFGETKDGEEFHFFASAKAAEQIEALEAKHDAEMRRLFLALQNSFGEQP